MKNHLVLLVFLFLAIAGCTEKKSEKNETETTAVDTTPTGLRLKALNEKLVATPNDPKGLHERAKLFIEMKRYPDALADMQKVMAIDSTKSEYFLTMADLAFAANRSYDAKENLEKALALNPDNTEAMMRLAELNLIVRQYAASVALLNKVLDKDKS